MALSAATLSALARANLLADEDAKAVDGDELTALCDAFAVAIVTHFTAAGVVLPTLLIAPAGGGPVTGTGTIT